MTGGGRGRLFSIIDGIIKERELIKAGKMAKRLICSHPHKRKKVQGSEETPCMSGVDLTNHARDKTKRQNANNIGKERYVSVGSFTIRFLSGHKASSHSEESQN